MGTLRRKLKQTVGLFRNRKENRRYVRWMLQTLSPYKGSVALILMISLFSILVSYASTIIGKYVVDGATTGQINLRNIALMCATTVVSILIGVGSRILGDYISEKFSFGIRASIFSKIQRGCWQTISQYHSEDLLTRMTSDVGSLSGGLISFIPSAVLTLFQLLIAFFILLYYDWVMALIALVIAPIGAVCVLVFRDKYQKYQIQLRESESGYRSFMQEMLANLTVVKTFQRENYNEQTVERLRSERLHIILRSSRLGALMGALMRLVYSMGYVIVFCLGAYRIATGAITYGTLTVFISLVSQIQGSISGLAGLIPMFYGMLISAKRICEVSETQAEQTDRVGDVPQQVGVQIQHVDFTYQTEKILSDISFCAAPGERVGIVGSSGVGKTTLIRLLLALVEPEQGSIVYTTENGGSEKASAACRRMIAYVPQGNTLLSGTIADNLRIGKEDATPEEMLRALQMADIADFVLSLPDGLNTTLSERSGGISEGQAQRISIARALLRDRPVLILDEATSALDEATEARVLQNITNHNTNKTCFVITHRRSMLRYCDKVIEIFDDGTMAARNL